MRSLAMARYRLELTHAQYHRTGAIVIETFPVNAEGTGTEDVPPFGWVAQISNPPEPLASGVSSNVWNAGSQPGNYPSFRTESEAYQASREQAARGQREGVMFGGCETVTTAYRWKDTEYGPNAVQSVLSALERDTLKRVVGFRPTGPHTMRLPASGDVEPRDLPVVHSRDGWLSFSRVLRSAQTTTTNDADTRDIGKCTRSDRLTPGPSR